MINPIQNYVDETVLLRNRLLDYAEYEKNQLQQGLISPENYTLYIDVISYTILLLDTKKPCCHDRKGLMIDEAI